MPITLSILEKKKIKSFFDDTEYVGESLYPKLDLTSNQWVIDYDKVIIDANISIDSSTEMRIDTIARYVLGTEDYVDVIVKFNKLQNPYGIKKGDVLSIPNLNSFFANLKMVNYKSKDIKNTKTVDSNTDTKTGNSIAVKTNGQGNKSYRKGENGVIVF